MSQIHDEITTRIFQLKPYINNYFNLFSDLKSPYILQNASRENEIYLQYGNKKLSSSISPKNQAQRTLSDNDYSRTDILIFLGLGNPHIFTETNQLAEGQIILFIDSDLEIVKTLWDSMKSTLAIAGRHLFCGKEFSPLLSQYIDSIPVNRISSIKFFKNQASISLNPEFYRETEILIQNQFSSKFSDLLTKFEFERIWIKNILINTINYSAGKCCKISDLQNQFSGLSALLVSAGPSLRKNCAYIKSNRDKLFILSCDTSLKVLLAHGIIPDGVVTLDAQTHSFFHFTGVTFKDFPLFADMVTFPPLLRNDCKIIHSMTAKYNANAAGEMHRETTSGGIFAENHLGKIGDIQSGGSVATTAFDILRFMGFQNIFLIGQDLAYSGREIHSTGTHHNEKWLTQTGRKFSLETINEKIIRKRKTKNIDSCDGKQVLTDYILEIYKFWFEQSALSLPDINIYNICGKGAIINNIPSISAQEFSEMLLAVPDHDYPWKKLEPWLPANQVASSDINLKNSVLASLYELSFKLKNINEQEKLEPYKWLKSITEKNNIFENLLRKTEIYMQRHKELDTNRQWELIRNSLKKEIKFLKKGILSGV